MRTASVFTHLRCNQRCSYCALRQPVDDPRAIARPAVQERIRSAIAEGASELTLTGGEPTMRADLEALVAFAKAQGASRVVLETNATLLDPARVAGLLAAGLDAARVNLVAFGSALDAITADEGGFEATLRGLRALAATEVELVVQAALIASAREHLPALPAALADAFPKRIAELRLVVPTESPDPAELLPPREVAALATAVAEAARIASIPAKLAPEAPPPCTFPELGRVAHLFALTRGRPARPDHRRIAACASCALADRCDGFAIATFQRFGAPDVAPVADDRMRRRLSLIATVEQQIARELVTRDRYSTPSGEVVEEDLVRINFQCNQSCRFCFVSTHLPTAGDAAIREAIVDAARSGRRVTLSGGEPTLNPSLVDYVRLARESSPHPIRLQTNAIRFASAALTDAVIDAGVGEAFVSLHGSRAEICDAVTHAPGTFAKSVIGIDHLVARGVLVVLNFVICETNRTDLVPYVELVARRWPGAKLNVSFVAPSTDVVPREHEFIPRYADALPHLAAAVVRAKELGVELVGFESMCGIPLCLVPDSLEGFLALGDVPPGYDRGEFVKPEPCRTCEFESRCYGLRRGYAELHGHAELRPVRSLVRTLPELTEPARPRNPA